MRTLEPQPDGAGLDPRPFNLERTLINRATRALNSSLDLDQVLATFLNEVCRILGVVGSSIWLLENRCAELVCLESSGAQCDKVKGWRIPAIAGIVGWIASKGRGIIVKDTRKDKRHFKKVDETTGIEVRSILGAPLKVRDKVIGVVQVVDTAVDRFDASHLGLLEGLAGNAAISIENARLYEKARQEIAERRKAEAQLKKKERLLKQNAETLKETNAALRVLLRRRDMDKVEFEERVLVNVKELIEPYAAKLRLTRLSGTQAALLGILESNLRDIISPFARRMSSRLLGLTPKELQVATLIKHGKTTKDIAAVLGISHRTIDTHRRNLRVKLGIHKQRANLRTHLLSLQ